MIAVWYDFVVALILFMVLDVCFLKFYFGKPYFKNIKDIQGTDLQVKYPQAGAAYICMLLGLFAITIPNIDPTTTSTLILTCLQFGGGLGCAIYGTYAFTCASIYTNFKTWIAVVDTLWGTFLYTVVPLITFAITRAIQN